MRDQAEKLRMKMLENKGALGRSIAVVSGKGGVGKSNFSTNFAINLSKLGKKVVIIDMDIGMANVHILVGTTSPYNLNDYLEGRVPLEQAMFEGPFDLQYIIGGSGLSSVMEWSNEMFDLLIKGFEQLQKTFDFIIFDMGAGATNWTLDLLTSIDEIVVITTAEPTSITDAYSMMKYIHLRDEEKNFYLVCNRVYSVDEGKETLTRIKNAMSKFLSKDVSVLGSLPEDISVRNAVKEQVPFALSYPTAPISIALSEIVTHFVNEERIEVHGTTKKATFLTKLRNVFLKGRD